MTTTKTKTRGDGMGRLREKRPGYWEGTVRAHGRQQSKCFKASGIREAEDLFRAWRGTLPAEPIHGTFGALLVSWVESIRPRGREDDLSPTTFTGYERIATKVAEELGSVPLADLKSKTLENYYKTLSTAAKASHYHSVVRRALNYGVRQEMIPVNPAAGGRVDVPTPAKPEMVMPTDDVADMLAEGAFASDPVLGGLVYLAMATGARQGELCALRWTDVDPEGGTVRIATSIYAVTGRAKLVDPNGKPVPQPLKAAVAEAPGWTQRRLALEVGVSEEWMSKVTNGSVEPSSRLRRDVASALGRPAAELFRPPAERTLPVVGTKDTKTHAARVLPVPAEVVAFLLDIRARQEARAELHGMTVAPDGYVFSWLPDCRTPIRPNTVSKWWADLADEYGHGEIKFHGLRHLMASRWVGAGVPLPVVSKMLGHKLVSTTSDYYAWAEQGAQREAADYMANRLPSLPRALGVAS